MSRNIDMLIDGLRAAGEPNRLRILALLRSGALSVGELVQVMGLSQPRLSHHLKTLTSAGLVERYPEGAWVFYGLPATGDHRALLDFVLGRISDSAAPFQGDRERLAAVKTDRARTADAYFSEVAETWDTVRSLHFPNEAIETALLDIAGPGPFRHCVDIGTGTGRMLCLFAPRAQRADGVDASHRMLTVARANLEAAEVSNAHVRHSDASDLPFQRASADLVIIHQVLHFIDAPERVVAEAARILAPDGRLLVVDFAPHELEFLREDHGHRWLGIRPELMAQWADASGLELADPREFAPPDGLAQGLAVNIWQARRIAVEEEVAA
ncbi:MAG: metalloregulator ArsR/SmtB family transcription factor [Pseudomonadota bacterium]